VSVLVWNGEEQPVDTIQDGDDIPACCYAPFGGIDSALLLRWLVPTLTEERAQKLADEAEARRLPRTASASRAFIAEMAPKRV